MTSWPPVALMGATWPTLGNCDLSEQGIQNLGKSLYLMFNAHLIVFRQILPFLNQIKTQKFDSA